jgi:hypothetical protein
MKPALDSLRIPTTNTRVSHDLDKIPVNGYEED